jgi:hypothetical protein
MLRYHCIPNSDSILDIYMSGLSKQRVFRRWYMLTSLICLICKVSCEQNVRCCTCPAVKKGTFIHSADYKAQNNPPGDSPNCSSHVLSRAVVNKACHFTWKDSWLVLTVWWHQPIENQPLPQYPEEMLCRPKPTSQDKAPPGCISLIDQAHTTMYICLFNWNTWLSV